MATRRSRVLYALRLFLGTLLCWHTTADIAAVDRSVYMDSDRPVNERVEAILKQMTLVEKQVLHFVYSKRASMFTCL